MFENPYSQNLQDQIGQLSKLLGGQAVAATADTMTNANRLDYVDGIDGARAFLQKMLASTKHIVWDNQKPVFYVLQKDANGSPDRIRICNFTVELEPTMEEKYVTREDFNALVTKLDRLIKREENDG